MNDKMIEENVSLISEIIIRVNDVDDTLIGIISIKDNTIKSCGCIACVNYILNI